MSSQFVVAFALPLIGFLLIAGIAWRAARLNRLSSASVLGGIRGVDADLTNILDELTRLEIPTERDARRQKTKEAFATSSTRITAHFLKGFRNVP